MTQSKLISHLGFLTFLVFYFLWDRASVGIDLRYIISLWAIFFFWNSKNFSNFSIRILAIPFFLIIQSLIIYFFFGYTPTVNSILSILLVFQLTIYFDIYRADLQNFLYKSTALFFTLNFFVQIMEITGLLNISTQASEFLPGVSRRAGLLNEPSHLAIIYAPILCAFFTDPLRFSKNIKWLPIIFGICSLIIAPITTLFFIVVVYLFFQVIFYKSLKYLSAFFLFYFVMSLIKNDLISLLFRLEIIIRYLLSFEYYHAPTITDNSTSVLLSNFATVLFSLSNFPFGIGPNMYEIVRKLSFRQIYGFDLWYPVTQLNINDGGSNLFKIFVEFGFFGFFFLYIIFRDFKRRYCAKDMMYIFCILAMIGSFARGVGYFSSGFYLSFLYLYHYEKFNKK